MLLASVVEIDLAGVAAAVVVDGEATAATTTIPHRRTTTMLARASVTRDRMAARRIKGGGLASGLGPWAGRLLGMQRVELAAGVAIPTRRLARDGEAAGGTTGKAVRGRRLGRRARRATHLQDMRAPALARRRGDSWEFPILG